MKKKGVKVEKVIQNDCFEIRKFTLDKGASLPPHTSPKDAYLQMLSGHIHFHIHEQIHDLKNTDSMSFPAHVMHEVISEEDAQFLIVR
jgi:quercetin dioxygenase-like cupin family protein